MTEGNQVHLGDFGLAKHVSGSQTNLLQDATDSEHSADYGMLKCSS